MRRLLWLYLCRRLPAFLAAAAAAGIFLFVFALYRLPAAAVLYASVLALLPAAAAVAWDAFTFCARMRCLEALTRDPSLVPERLPAVRDPIEDAYQSLLRAVAADRAAACARTEAECAERVSYYTVWAHQITTPIAALRLLLQSGETDARALSAEVFRIEEYVEMAMCYLRLDGASDYVIAEFPLDGVIRQCARRYAPLFIRKNIRFVYETADARVLSDEKWLAFLLGQLLSNALKYTPPGGTVAIDVTDGPVLTVRDSGIGIPKSDIPRVFERGYTGAAGRSDQRASGIGLYLCRRIAGNLGHTLTLTSEPGRGTEVRLDLTRRPLPVE